MSFEIGKTFNGGAEWLCGSSLVYGTLRNPVVTALLITALALIIIYVMYKEDLKGTGWRRGVKTGFWVAIGVSALVFVHYYALERSMRKGNASQGVRDVMASIHHSATATKGYSVLGGDHDEDGSPRRRPAADDDSGDDEDSSGEEAAAPRGAPRRRADNVAGTSAMDELGLQRVVLTSSAGHGARD